MPGNLWYLEELMQQTEQACQVSDEEILAHRRECWRPGCKRRAFLRDWKGWKWCAGCWWRQARQETHFWLGLRGLRIF